VIKPLSEALTCFKAYDIRGQIPAQINEDICYRIGRAFAQVLGAKSIVVGHDIRLTSPAFCDAVTRGLLDAGCDVTHIGQCGTEEIYFATAHGGYDGGLVVTASHNPIDYNGIKFVREGARPISGDDGLPEIKALAESGDFAEPASKGSLKRDEDKSAYIKHLLGYVDAKGLRPLKLVVNAGNGGAGTIVDLLEKHLPFEFIKVHHQPDGNFPNGIPNPLLPENREATANAVREAGADMGIAWDGDFDRCFFFDENGEFIEGYYLVGLLAEAFLRKQPGSAIVHDPRLTWNTMAMVSDHGGRAVQSRTGHSFIKQVMRNEDAVYGGEMSAHHYFRDFAYCDSGMIPWLLVAELVSVSGKSLSQWVEERIRAYPCSGEINSKVEDARVVIEKIEDHFGGMAGEIDRTDGLSINFDNWRFNVRMSNTEPVVRLNVESRADIPLMKEKTAELLELIRG
jgi:phosphomannomutase